ncbi:MAG TPA: hypothetical protein VKC65_04970, partial [Gaiellaceae bacterium]|nr:hypothetical protein [Gaiellaceae bacterium]
VEQGTAVCRASIAKRASGLAVVRRLHAVAHVFAESSARCTWRIPRSAKGKFVTATVTVRSGQFHLGWTFSRHVR